MSDNRTGISKDAAHLRDVLEKGVILVDGGSDGSIDVGADKSESVWVAIVVDVNGYGPHTGTICAMQNRFHGNADEPLQEAFELLEEWKREHYADYYKELEKEKRAEHPDLSEEEFWNEHGHEVDEAFHDTFDGWSFRLEPGEFGRAIAGTDATKFIETYDSHAEEREELRAKLRELEKFYARYDEPSSEEVKARSKRIEQLLEAGDNKAAERELDALDKL